MLRAPSSTEVDRPEVAPSTTVNNDAPLSDLDVAYAISLALARSGMSSKAAAVTMGLDAAQWSRQMNSQDAHVSLQRLRKLPAGFWVELLAILAAPLGLVVAHPMRSHLALARVLEMATEVARYAAQEQALRRVG